jgi:hypothetical protein
MHTLFVIAALFALLFAAGVGPREPADFLSDIKHELPLVDVRPF